MRPALRALLSRPRSLDLLRHLVGTPIADSSNSISPRRRRRRRVLGYCGVRDYGCSSAALADGEEPCRWEHQLDVADVETLPRTSKKDSSAMLPETPHSKTKPDLSYIGPRIRYVSAKTVPGCWDEGIWTHDKLEFESSIPAKPDGKVRLVDTPEHEHDLKLWLRLLNYRKRLHGPAGVGTVWNAMRRRNIKLPTEGDIALKFWSTFLDVGYKTLNFQRQIIEYADKLLEESSARWPLLYTFIIQNFLLKGKGDAALLWHRRLLERHPPAPVPFSQMCRNVAFHKGDMKSLRTIYLENKHRNVYQKVLPVLYGQDDFGAALEWHALFVKHGDLPTKSATAEPLIRFLAAHEPRKAIIVTRSLVDAGVNFPPKFSSTLEGTSSISREIMNLVHGEKFDISVKKYNDDLGARWFATTWFSLGVAIEGIHALGIQEIGPLSLQAIARRDQDVTTITRRIKDLRQRGISIGSSTFARAIETFARDRKQDLLDGLLNSDQHPDELENLKLQEELMASYARVGDWAQWRRTLEIRSLASKVPEIEKSNLILRSQVRVGNVSAMLETIEDMALARTPVTSKTIAHILRHTLNPRQIGRRPMTVRKHAGSKLQDLDISIAILKKIMSSGSMVPAIHWREIIRRLGMLSRFDDMRNLSVYLAAWYGRAIQPSLQLSRSSANGVPLHIPKSHQLHPLAILFNTSLQKAIVEWGFISALRIDSHQHRNHNRDLVPYGQRPLPNLALGIRLLKQLSRLGVVINGASVRAAIFHRLITYFGPGRSTKPYNRIAKTRLLGKMNIVVGQIDDALEGAYFSDVGDLPRTVEALAMRRLRRLGRKRNRVGITKTMHVDPLLAQKEIRYMADF